MANEIATNAETVQAITNSVLTALLSTGAIKPPKQDRKRVNWERLLMYEYVNKYYSNQPHWFRCEVGAIPPGGGTMLYARTRRYADAIIRMPDHMIIIEGKMRCRPDVVSQLQNYRDLFPDTPIFTKYKNEPIKLKVVAAMIDGQTKAFIEKRIEM